MQDFLVGSGSPRNRQPSKKPDSWRQRATDDSDDDNDRDSDYDAGHGMFVCVYVCMYVWMDGWMGVDGDGDDDDDDDHACVLPVNPTSMTLHLLNTGIHPGRICVVTPAARIGFSSTCGFACAPESLHDVDRGLGHAALHPYACLGHSALH